MPSRRRVLRAATVGTVISLTGCQGVLGGTDCGPGPDEIDEVRSNEDGGEYVITGTVEEVDYQDDIVVIGDGTGELPLSVNNDDFVGPTKDTWDAQELADECLEVEIDADPYTDDGEDHLGIATEVIRYPDDDD